MRTNDFIKAMSAFKSSKSFLSFLAKEEERLGVSFFSIGKMSEESRFISYLNWLVKRRNARPANLDEVFFQTWKNYSGYLPFEGTSGLVRGKMADMKMVVLGLQYAAEVLGIELDTSSLTQEDWDKNFEYWDKRLFGSMSDNSVPF